MKADAQARATDILARLSANGSSAPASPEELVPLVYADLRRLAGRYLSRERPGHTLQPTALVHEAYLKLIDQTRVDWQGKTHFFAVGAQIMRRLLVDHARQRKQLKRGGDQQRVTLADVPAGRDLDLDEILGLDEALERLAQFDERSARIVELRFFAGLKVKEVAHVLGVSTTTVEDDWTHARAWLKEELSPGEAS